MQRAFVLDEGCNAVLSGSTSITKRWTEFGHMRQRERGLSLRAGESLQIGAILVPPEPVLWIRCLRGLPQIGVDGVDVEIWAWTDKSTGLLLSQRLDNAQPEGGLREVVIDLPISADTECAWKSAVLRTRNVFSRLTALDLRDW